MPRLPQPQARPLLPPQARRRAHASGSAPTSPSGPTYTFSYDAERRKLSETDGITAINSQNFAYAAGRLTGWNKAASTQSWNLSLVGEWTQITSMVRRKTAVTPRCMSLLPWAESLERLTPRAT